jgi:tartrate dehydratase beta subunit/fumarate hydratase class I family protein
VNVCVLLLPQYDAGVVVVVAAVVALVMWATCASVLYKHIKTIKLVIFRSIASKLMWIKGNIKYCTT